MSLPILRSVQDCSNFTLTVMPFIPQLLQLPARLGEKKGDYPGMMQVYIDTNPLVSAFAASLALSAIFVVVSEATRNYSQVDRMWSMLPNFYILHLAVWARLNGLPHERMDLIAAFSTVWSIRLTYNYGRRGGYNKGSQDYRWDIIRSRIPPALFGIFNLVVIALFQSVLLFLFSCGPAYAILLSTQFQSKVQMADYIFLAIELILVTSEWFSDGQQWNYQTAKQLYRKDAKLSQGYTQADLERGFVTSGLWGYSRHPNFLAEQTIWLVLYQWACYSTNSFYNWTMTGSALLILLFQGSTRITEAISASKYPEYADYQKLVGTFLPTSLRSYRTPVHKPKIIKTSDLAKRQQEKEKLENKKDN